MSDPREISIAGDAGQGTVDPAEFSIDLNVPKETHGPFQYSLASLLALVTITALVMSGISSLGGWNFFWVMLFAFLSLPILLGFAGYFLAPFAVLMLYCLVPGFGRRGVVVLCILIACVWAAMGVLVAVKTDPRGGIQLSIGVAASWLIQLHMIWAIASMFRRRQAASRLAMAHSKTRALPDEAKLPGEIETQREAIDWTPKD